MSVVRPLKYLKIWWTLGLLMLLAVILGSFLPIPSPPAPEGLPIDKVIHLSAYSLLSLWFVQLNKRTIWVCGIVFSIGLAIELTQPLTQYRYFEWLDILANTFGVFIGGFLGRGLFKNIFQKLETLLKN
jgi:VanZ family protein